MARPLEGRDSSVIIELRGKCCVHERRDGVSGSLVQKGRRSGEVRFILQDVDREVLEFSLDLDPFPLAVPNEALVLRLPPVARNASFFGTDKV